MENTGIDIMETDVSQVPSVVRERVDGLKRLRKNVVEATKKAEDAKDSAKSAKEKSAGLFHKKEAIESLQNAATDLADAQISAAQAQEVFFEYQKKVIEITQYLFALGAANIAANRSVVRELELKLKGATKEELDEFARNEILTVIKQLKAQEDIMKKQSDLTEKVKAHEVTLKGYAQKSSEYDKKLKEYGEHAKTQDYILRGQTEKDKEHDRLIANNKQKTIEHDRLFAEKNKER